MRQTYLVYLLGSLVNLIWFGLAKLLIGEYAAGIRRMLLHILILLILSYLSWYNHDLSAVLSLLYRAGAAVAGFRTLQQARVRLEINNKH